MAAERPGARGSLACTVLAPGPCRGHGHRQGRRGRGRGCPQGAGGGAVSRLSVRAAATCPLGLCLRGGRGASRPGRHTTVRHRSGLLPLHQTPEGRRGRGRRGAPSLVPRQPAALPPTPPAPCLLGACTAPPCAPPTDSCSRNSLLVGTATGTESPAREPGSSHQAAPCPGPRSPWHRFVLLATPDQPPAPAPPAPRPGKPHPLRNRTPTCFGPAGCSVPSPHRVRAPGVGPGGGPGGRGSGRQPVPVSGRRPWGRQGVPISRGSLGPGRGWNVGLCSPEAPRCGHTGDSPGPPPGPLPRPGGSASTWRGPGPQWAVPLPGFGRSGPTDGLTT